MLEVARAGAGYELALPAWGPSPKPLPAIVAALGIDSAVETLWHQHRYGLIVLDTAEQVRALDPDFRALAREGDVLTIVTAPGRGYRRHQPRVRARRRDRRRPGDRLGACGDGALLGEAARPRQLHRVSGEQARRASDCRLDGDRVVLGGNCVTVMEGVFRL